MSQHLSSNLIMIIILSLCSFAKAANEAAALYCTMEGFANGDDLASEAAMGVMSKTNGGVVGFQNHATVGNHTIRTENHPGLLRPIKVGSTLYTNQTDTRIWECNNVNGVNTNYLSWTFAVSKKVSFGMELTLTNWSVGNGNFYNPCGLYGGSPYSVLSIRDDNPITFGCETNSGVGTLVNTRKDVTYWITCLWDSANSKTIWHFYIRSNMTLAGVSSGAVVLNSTINELQVGVIDAHTRDTGQKYRFGNIVLYTNGAVFPVMPGTFLQVPTNLSPTAVSAAIAAASDLDSIILPSTNATWTSGVMFNKNSVDMSGIVGTNETIIIATNISTFTAFNVTGSLNTFSNFTGRGDLTNNTVEFFHNVGFYNRYTGLFIQEMLVAMYAEAPGLMDHCILVDNSFLGRNIFGSSFYDTYYPMARDSTNVFVYEDIDGFWTEAHNETGSRPFFSSQEGQCFIVRHSRFSANKTGLALAPFADYHGDWDPGPDAFYRPGVFLGIYKVTLTMGSSSISGQKFVDLRGGESGIYSNQVNGAQYDADKGIVYREEHPEDTSPYTVTNSFNCQNFDNNGAHAMAVNTDLNVLEGRNYTNTCGVFSLVTLPYPHPLIVPPTPYVLSVNLGKRLKNIKLRK
jgi:hypothetical protein